MPKKPAKNGYFFFMLNFKRRAENRGCIFPGGLQEVAKAASEEWKSLPEFRKDYFNRLAKEKKNDPRPNVPKRDEKRFNSLGVSYAELKMTKAREEEKLRQQNEFITQFVNQMNLNDLRDKLMYLIHVNIFCKTNDERYYPAEIALVKFSLRGGVKGVFHRYIDPGDIAPGYSYEVKEHSERTHKLTLQFVRSVDGTSDFSRLYEEICQFLLEDEKENDGVIPPLFTMYDNLFLNSSLNAVKGALKSLWFHVHPSHDFDDDRWERMFRVLPLPDMFHRLKNRCMAVTNPNTVAFPNVVLAKTELQKDTYHYDLDSSCKFHRDEDIIFNCSQSFVLRWVYIIRDHCADLIGVDLFPKYIVPKVEVKTEKEEGFDDSSSMTNSQYSFSESKTSIGSLKFMKPEPSSETGSLYSYTCSKASVDVPKYLKSECPSATGSEYSYGRSETASVDFSKLAKPETSGDWSASSSQFKIKDEKPDTSHLKRERGVADEDADANCGPKLKREKPADDYPALTSSSRTQSATVGQTTVKSEKECSVKSENVSNTDFIAVSIKSEKDNALVGLVRVKEEKCVASICATGLVKDEKIEVNSTVKTEKDVYCIKEEKEVETIKQEKNADPIKEVVESGIKEEKDPVVKEEKIDPGYD